MGGKKTILAAEWVDAELISNIKLRSNYSRQWNLARKNKESEEVIEGCKRRYLEQQKITSIMSGNKKGQLEENKINETWNDGKTFWTMIKELLGKNKEKEEEAFVFTEEGEKKEIMEYNKEYADGWKSSVYQKSEKTDISFW